MALTLEQIIWCAVLVAAVLTGRYWHRHNISVEHNPHLRANARAAREVTNLTATGEVPGKSHD